MGSKGGRPTDLTEVVQSRRATTTLVVGATSHDAACSRLARAGPGRGYRVRTTTTGSPDAPHADTDDQYETGVYDDLAVADAGIAVSDTIANLAHDEGSLESGRVVVCVDGQPKPSTRAERRDLVQFLHAITHRVEDVDGHCHVHLPVEPDAHVTDVIAPVFDYVVNAADVEDGDQ